MKKTTFLAFLFSAFGILSAAAQTTNFYDGIFVVNEGGYMAGNASLSYFGTDGELQNDVYNTVNNDTLGDTAQHMAFYNDRAYVVLNGSHEIVIAQAGSMQEIARISDSTNLYNPRYIGFHGNKAYVTCWGDIDVPTDDFVAVINLENNNFITKIPVSEGPEEILVVGDRIFVSDKGGKNYNFKVEVINPATDTVLQTLAVGWVPGSMAVLNNQLYVMCEGKPSYADVETTGRLFKFNLGGTSITLSSSVNFPNIQHPSNMQLLGTDIYYTMGSAVYKTLPTDQQLPTAPIFTLPAEQGIYGIYGFNIIDGKLYVSDVVDYVADGKVFIYTPEGELLEEHTVGKLPNGFYKSPSQPLSVNSNNAVADVVVYPNPATSVIYISAVKTAAVKLYDVTGRMVKNEEYTMAGINLTGLSKGNYFMEITSENAKTVKQIVIK